MRHFRKVLSHSIVLRSKMEPKLLFKQNVLSSNESRQQFTLILQLLFLTFSNVVHTAHECIFSHISLFRFRCTIPSILPVIMKLFHFSFSRHSFVNSIHSTTMTTNKKRITFFFANTRIQHFNVIQIDFR